MLPEYPLKTRQRPDNEPVGSIVADIWDPIRQKYVPLTPEEQVRQRLIIFLCTQYQVPASAIAVERKVLGAVAKQRYDLLIYNRFAVPVLLAECKAPGLSLSDAALQVARYQQAAPTHYLILTNGDTLLTYSKTPDGCWASCPDLPVYKFW